MQNRDQTQGRMPPEGMPTQVPPRRPQAPPPARDQLPVQKPVTDEPEQRPPAKWKKTVKRVLAVLGLLLSLTVIYVFLLMGEPDEDDQLQRQTARQEESIRVPIAATQVDGTADVNPLATNFGMPVLALYGSPLTLTKATLFDTAFHGGYARRMQLTYAFATGETLSVESIRPTAAVSLLGFGSMTLRMDSLYAIAGMDAVRVDGQDAVLVLARGREAAYAVVCPKTQESGLVALLKQATLMQPNTTQ